MIGDIIEFLKSAKTCVDTIIKELEELKELEGHKMKKINLFIEIIKELGSSVVNLEKAYEASIPLEHKLKYLIIKELKFDLEDFTESLREYKTWYQVIKTITKPSKFFEFGIKWFCCGSNISNISDPSELTQIIESDISGSGTNNSINILDASVQLANILPSTMNKRLDESFHKIMDKLMIVIELEKEIFGTAINIDHPILRRAWMNLGPIDKLQNEVEQYKLEESLLSILKDENHGIIVNETKCTELICDFLEGLEKKAGNKPNGRISIDELNECVITDNNIQSVLGLLGLTTQPGCNLDGFEDIGDCEEIDTETNSESSSNNKPNIANISSNPISSDQILKTLAKYVSEYLNSQTVFVENLQSHEQREAIELEDVKIVCQPDTLENTKSPTASISEHSSTHSEEIATNIIRTDSIQQSKSKTRRTSIQSPKAQISISSSTYTLIRLLKINNFVFVSSRDNSGLLNCEGYGSNWPYKIAFEFDVPEITNVKSFGGIRITCECTDQGWGGTGHDNVRYQVGSNKIIPAFFIDRDKNPSSIYTHLIKPEEIESNAHIIVWLCSAPWDGWSATMKSAIAEIKYI